MVELILVRHAKSDWGDPGLSDHDRPLNSRGEQDAPAMAAWLAKTLAQADEPVDRILSSTALRARTTARHFGKALGREIELDPELYLAPPTTLLAKAAFAGVSRVMVVAHDPGLSDIASELSNGVINHMPTCAVARFDWNADNWADAQHQHPNIWSFETPKSLRS